MCILPVLCVETYNYCQSVKYYLCIYYGFTIYKSRMEFQYYGNFDRPPTRRILDQPWWDEEDTLSDRRINGKK